jgi:hypothetical protein
MKLIILLSMLISGSAFADSAKFNISPFRGEIMAGSEIKIDSMILNARIQHCNFWGTTCAGGPAEQIEESMAFKNDTSANLVSFELKKSISLKSFKPTNRFSSCNLSLTIFASNEKGENLEGHIGLIHQNDKSKCESVESVRNQITDKLKVPQRVNFWRR